jgi:hypothetical protein
MNAKDKSVNWLLILSLVTIAGAFLLYIVVLVGIFIFTFEPFPD